MSKLFDLLGLGGGKKFYMRDFKNAYKFRPDTNPARQRFQGYVNFIFNRSLFSDLYSDSGDASNEFRTTISSLVRTADLPSVSFKTEVKNSYNRKKIVNTGVEYEPVNITVFDTVGNEWLITLMKYFAYHYMDPRNKFDSGRDIESMTAAGDGSWEDLNSFFGKDGTWDSNVAGYNVNYDPHFFERIDYVLYHGNKGVQYSIINPVLRSFKTTEIDYSSSEFREFQLSFDYERFTVYNIANFGLSEADLDRFENASNLTGPAFEAGPTLLAMEETPLGILGQAGATAGLRYRSPQPVIVEPVQTEPDPNAAQIDPETGELVTPSEENPDGVTSADPEAVAAGVADTNPDVAANEEDPGFASDMSLYDGEDPLAVETQGGTQLTTGEGRTAADYDNYITVNDTSYRAMSETINQEASYRSTVNSDGSTTEEWSESYETSSTTVSGGSRTVTTTPLVESTLLQDQAKQHWIDTGSLPTGPDITAMPGTRPQLPPTDPTALEGAEAAWADATTAAGFGDQLGQSIAAKASSAPTAGSAPITSNPTAPGSPPSGGSTGSAAGESVGGVDLRPTYGAAATIATGAGDGKKTGGWFGDLLGSVAGSALTAVIHGGSVKDAVIGTAVGTITTKVGTTLRNAVDPNSPSASKPIPNQPVRETDTGGA